MILMLGMLRVHISLPGPESGYNFFKLPGPGTGSGSRHLGSVGKLLCDMSTICLGVKFALIIDNFTSNLKFNVI